MKEEKVNSYPKVSVIVPIFKVEQFLTKCIDSILNQSYANIEVILVDDGSPDRCPQICDDYQRKDSRVKVVHKQNGGQSSARNAGLDVASGEYVSFVDSDDWLESDAYSMIVGQCLENQLDIIGGGIDTFVLGKKKIKFLKFHSMILSVS